MSEVSEKMTSIQPAEFQMEHTFSPPFNHDDYDHSGNACRTVAFSADSVGLVRIKLDTASYVAISQLNVVKSAGGSCSPIAVPRMNKYVQFWATVVRSRDKK